VQALFLHSALALFAAMTSWHGTTQWGPVLCNSAPAETQKAPARTHARGTRRDGPSPSRGCRPARSTVQNGCPNQPSEVPTPSPCAAISTRAPDPCRRCWQP
jgi:hypothetical protein